MKNQRGAVSIFLLLLLLIIFFFHAVLIDYARVMIAQKQSEDQLKIAARSVMSTYDVVLKELYGLYGTSAEDKTELVTELIQLNAHKKPIFFNVVELNYDPASIQVSLDRPLGDPTIFRQQILDEMKYKAPIDFTLKLVEKISPISLAMGAASSTVRALQDMQELYEDREHELQESLMHQRKAYEQIQVRMSEQMRSREIIYTGYSNYVSAMEELAYLQRTGLDAEAEEEEQRAWQEQVDHLSSELQQYEQGGGEQLQVLFNALEEHERLLEEAKKRLHRAQEKNEQMKLRLLAAQDDQPPEYGLVEQEGDKFSQYATEHGYTEQITDIKQSLEELIVDPTYFDELKERVLDQEKRLIMLQSLTNEMSAFFHAALSRTTDTLGGNDTGGQAAFVLQIDSYSTYCAILLNEQSRQIDQLHAGREEAKAIEEEYREVAREASDGIKGLLQRVKELQGDQEEFNQVQELFEYYWTKHHETSTGSPEEHELTADPDGTARAAMERVDALFTLIGQALLSIRDELYMNEYTLTRFDHIQLEQLKNAILTPDDLSENEGESYTLQLKEQEVEYILYGFQDPVANVGAVLTEIFLLRLAIHSIDAFISCARTGHPFAILACILGTAFQQTLKDLKSLLHGEAIRLTQRVPIHFTYEDHLHLFLFLHPSSKQIHRLQALIQLRTGKDLYTLYTLASTQAESSFRLWFLPNVIKAISYAGNTNGQVDQGRYYISKTHYFSY